MKKRLFALLLVLALALSLAACGGGGGTATPTPAANNTPGGNAPSNPSTPSEPSEPVEIIAGFNLTPNGLDPISEDQNTTISVCNHFYDHLVELDADYNWIPSVAKSWVQLDGVTWEFEINLDYKFQNGDQLTMDDVVYSIERLKDIPKSADAASQIKSVSYEGTTLTVNLVEPNNTTIARLIYLAVIVNKAYIEANGDDAIYLKPIGTGPYMVTEFTPGASVTIETWDGYPFEKPQIDKITFIMIPENANRYIAVESGQTTYAGLVTAFEMDLAKKAGSFNLIEKLSNRTCLFFVNTERKPFDDVNVRRAMAHALDRESICELAGGRHPLESPIFGGFTDLYHVSDNLPEYDMDKARELLEAAGISPSSPINIEMVYFFDDPGIELYQSALKSLGINVTLSLCEFSVYLSREGPGDFDMIWSGLRNIAGSALMDLERFDSNFVGTRNLSRYVNPEMDELINRARVTTDQNELKELATEIADLVAEESSFIPVFLQTIYAVMDSNLSGVSIRGDQVQSFRNAVYTG